MKLKQKLTAVLSALLIVGIMPLNAMAAVKVKVYGDKNIYGTGKPFDTYIDMDATEYGLVRNNVTIKLELKNGKFALDKNGEYLPVYVTESRGEVGRNNIKNRLAENEIYGFGIIPTDSDSISLKIPERLIDGHTQIMFTAVGGEYGDVSVSMRDNRELHYMFVQDRPVEKEENKEPAPEVVEKKKIVIPTDNNIVMMGDYPVEFDRPAYVTNGRTKVSVRAVSDIFGAEIHWNGAEKSVTMELGEDEFKMYVGNRVLYINDFGVPMTSGPELTDGRVYLPLRDIAGMFGIEDIEWNEKTKSVEFELETYKGHTFPIYD